MRPSGKSMATRTPSAPPVDRAPPASREQTLYRSELALCERSRAGLGDVETLVLFGRYEEAASVLESRADRARSPEDQAAELTLRAVLALHAQQNELALRYLSEAERALALPFLNLLGSARIAYYRGVVHGRMGRCLEARAWLVRAAHLVRCAGLIESSRNADDATQRARHSAVRQEALAIGDALRELDRNRAGTLPTSHSDPAAHTNREEGRR